MVLDMVAQFPAQQLLAFMAGALVLNLTPGQDVFFASACGIQNGPRAGALAGLGALVAAHPGALVAIKYMGAAYLLVLAWKSWHAAAAPEGLSLIHI